MPEKEELQHYVIFSYSLAYLSQKNKVKALRQLLGYKNVKGKVYEHIGLVQEHNATKLGQNVILVPFDSVLPFQSFFSENNISVEVTEVWLKK